MKQQKTVGGIALRYGSYSLIVTAVVLAVLILVNLAAGLLPATYTSFSVSPQDIYAISDVSRSYMKALDDKVTVYVIASDSSMDNIVYEYVDRYSDLSSKLSVKTVDPILRPNFVSSYVEDTFDSATTNLLVVNEETGRARLVLNNQIYYQQYTDQELYYYYMTYGTMPNNPTYFNLENALLSAIDYVSMDQLPTVYYTAGHGELSLEDAVKKLFDKENIVLKELKLASVSEIPSDASLVLIYVPTMDFTEAEIATLRAFADKGGHILLSSYDVPKAEQATTDTADSEEAPETDTADPETPNDGEATVTPSAFANLYRFAAEYGLLYQQALVLEGDSSHYSSYYGPSYIHATLTSNAYASAVPSNTYVLMALAHGIQIQDSLTGVTVTKLMTTTTKAYGKTLVDKNTTVEKQEGDLEGQFILAAKSDKIGSKGISSFVWLTSPLTLDAGTIGTYSNISYMMAVITDLCDKEASVTVNSPTLQVEALSISESAAGTWSVILIGVIPAATLLCGFFLWRRRSTR